MVDFDHITTRGGDDGQTSLLNGERRFKHESVFEVLGDVDELSCALGLFRATIGDMDSELGGRVLYIQRLLIPIGGQIATPPTMEERFRLPETEIESLETWQKSYMKGMRITGFVIPGATLPAAQADLARAVCRRAERHLVKYIAEIHDTRLYELQRYLNRLSDFLFVVARYLAQGLNET